VVYREVCTEGSQTAKSGTDEQKRDMRHSYSGKQAHHCNAQRIPLDFSQVMITVIITRKYYGT
ncbi:MAG: hypothetical protein WAO52_04805, partial [Prolixibacteraceae bacterium]